MKKLKKRKDGWSVYARSHRARKPLTILRRAITLIRANVSLPRVAVDLGCGPGAEALLLQRAGYVVHAVETNRVARSILRQRVQQQRKKARRIDVLLPELHIHSCRMAEFKLPKVAMLVAIRSLAFETKRGFRRLLTTIPKAIAPGGILVCHFFGPQDTWVRSGGVQGRSVKQVRQWLRGFKVHELRQQYTRRRSVTGQLKNWHDIWVIAERR